jgi:heptosyltransferase-1
MGDIICTLPALTDAKKVITEISYDWVVEENFIEIPRWHYAVDTVIPIALRRWRKQILNLNTLYEMRSFLIKLAKQKYDYIIDAQGLIKSAIVATIAHGTSYGFNLKSIREPLASCLYQKKIAIPKDWHSVERIRQLFALVLGYQVPITVPDYGINIKKLSRFSSIPSSEKYLLFIHGSSRQNKCWKEEKWLELASLAEERGIKVKLPWGNNVEFIRAKKIAKIGNNIEVLPKLTISELGALMLKAQGVIAVDTGLGHLAAALSIPTISLYGPTNPKLGGTYGCKQYQLTHMETLEPRDLWEKIVMSLFHEL